VPLLNRRELADYLSISPTTVARMAKRGDLPTPMRLGQNIVRWDLTKIDKIRDSFSKSGGYDDPDEMLMKEK
jgi:predicted DNA-binding transcriptional regulator AlpA